MWEIRMGIQGNRGGNARKQGGDAGNQYGNLSIAVEMT